MQKSSLKLYFGTFLLTLTLASSGFAGDGQCPIAPPPPPHQGGRMDANINPVFGSNYISLNDFLEILERSVSLF